MVCLENEQRPFCHFWDCNQVLHFGLCCWLWGLLHLFQGILAHRNRYNSHLNYLTIPVLEKEMATHSSILAWRIPGIEEPGGLLSMGLRRVRLDWSDLAAAFQSILVHWFLKCRHSLLPSPVWPLLMPWFVELTFQVPMQYCSLQHWTLLPSVTSRTGCCFSFGSIPSFFLELFLHWSPVAYWAPTDLGSSSFSVLSFCLFILFMGFSRQEYWSGLPSPSPVDHRMRCKYCFMGTEFQFGKMNKIWRWLMVTVIWQRDCI